MKGLSLKIAVLATTLYWVWEVFAEGNIRIDLLVIFPILTVLYLYALWRKFKFWSIIITVILMAINYFYSQSSYSLFDKFPG